MKSTLLFALIMSISCSTFAQNDNLGSKTNYDKALKYNEKDITATTPSGEVIYKSRRELDDQLKKAVSLYSKEQYADAYPLVSELSQWGIKKAQMLLGDMYMHGFHLEQSTKLSLAWLGVAKEVKSERQAEKMFQHVYKQLDEKQKASVDKLVGTYIAKYGVKAQNIKCRKSRPVGSNIPEKHCKKKSNSNSILHPIS